MFLFGYKILNKVKYQSPYVGVRVKQRVSGKILEKRIISFNNRGNHRIPPVTTIREQYYASVVERKTDHCLWEHQNISVEPKKIVKPIVDFWSSIRPPKSISQYPFNWWEFWFGKKIPWEEVDLWYDKTHLTAAHCFSIRQCMKWETILTKNEISGLVKVRFYNPPIILNKDYLQGVQSCHLRATYYLSTWE